MRATEELCSRVRIWSGAAASASQGKGSQFALCLEGRGIVISGGGLSWGDKQEAFQGEAQFTRRHRCGAAGFSVA